MSIEEGHDVICITAVDLLSFSRLGRSVIIFGSPTGVTFLGIDEI